MTITTFSPRIAENAGKTHICFTLSDPVNDIYRHAQLFYTPACRLDFAVTADFSTMLYLLQKNPYFQFTQKKPSCQGDKTVFLQKISIFFENMLF